MMLKQNTEKILELLWEENYKEVLDFLKLKSVERNPQTGNSWITDYNNLPKQISKNIPTKEDNLRRGFRPYDPTIEDHPS